MTYEFKAILAKRMVENDLKMGEALHKADVKRSGTHMANMNTAMSWEHIQEIRQEARQRKEQEYGLSL